MQAASLRQVNEAPRVEEFRALRLACGLSDRAVEAASAGLPNSLFATVIRHDKRLVAMGRVVGDGGCNFEVVDIAVHPDFQRQGLGQQIMQAIMDYLHAHAPESAYVSMIADDHAPALYRKFGFTPTAPASIGMALKIKR